MSKNYILESKILFIHSFAFSFCSSAMTGVYMSILSKLTSMGAFTIGMNSYIIQYISLIKYIILNSFSLPVHNSIITMLFFDWQVKYKFSTSLSSSYPPSLGCNQNITYQKFMSLTHLNFFCKICYILPLY